MICYHRDVFLIGIVVGLVASIVFAMLQGVIGEWGEDLRLLLI